MRPLVDMFCGFVEIVPGTNGVELAKFRPFSGISELVELSTADAWSPSAAPERCRGSRPTRDGPCLELRIDPRDLVHFQPERAEHGFLEALRPAVTV
jgi:hypothetical protein